MEGENPARTAAQGRRGRGGAPARRAARVGGVLGAGGGWAAGGGASGRWLEAGELPPRPGGQPPQAFGRFQADRVNEIWTADLMNGPGTGGRACYLAAIIDDHSRFLTGHQFVRRPDAIRFAAVLRSAVERHGLPAVLYTDHGGCFTDASLARTCAVLGIRLVHSQPGKPAGRGKIERGFETIQQQFLVEISGDKDDPARHPLADLRQLNDLLDHRVRAVYHHPVHSETGQAPQARFDAAGPAALPDPALLRQAFAWRVVRLVRKAATGALGGNTQSGDPSLRGRE